MSLSESFSRSGFAKVVNTTAGRWVRIVAGILLVAWGISVDGTAGTIILIVGLVPLVAGLFNWCLVSALLGGPIDGSKVVRRDG